MTNEEIDALIPGFYRLKLRSGDNLTVAIGRNPDSNKTWVAAPHWVSPCTDVKAEDMLWTEALSAVRLEVPSLQPAPQKAPAADPTKCLRPGCGGEPHSRGLCRSCYPMVIRLVDSGKTTWEALEKTGKVLPLKRKRISASTKNWFSET